MLDTRSAAPYCDTIPRRIQPPGGFFAMSGRRHALKLAFLTAALGLVILCLVALACAPGAPAGQGGAVGGAVDAESTNTPTPEPTAEAGTEATSAPALPSTPSPTDTAAPTPTPTSEPDAARLGPIVSAYVQGQATRQAAAQAQGASGQAAPAKTLAVQIFVYDASKRGEVTAFLESRDIAHSPAPGTSHIYATVPVSFVASLAAHSGVNEILALPSPYSNMTTHLNTLAARYEAGLMPDEDTNPTFARLVIGIEGGDNYDAVKRFLDSKGAVMAFAERDMAEIYRPAGDLVAFVPVAQIATLARMTGVVGMWIEKYPVPAEARYTAGSIYDIPTATPTPMSTPTSAPTASNPDRSPTLDAGVSGAATTAPATPTPAPTPTLFLINNGTPWPLEHPDEHDNPKLDSRLFYLALEYEKTQSAAQGVSGQAAQPAAEVDVLIMPDAEESIPAIVQFLKDNGASPTYAYMGLPNDGYGHYQLGATLLVSILVRLSEQSGVLFVEHPGEPSEE